MRLSFKIIPAKAKGKAICNICGTTNELVSRAIGVCPSCVHNRGKDAVSYALTSHRTIRRRHGLPADPPRSDRGIVCQVCANECVIGEGESGYCGLRVNKDGRLVSLTSPNKGVYYAYLDPHVTNCCSAPFCPAGTGAGYPKFAYRNGPELGYYNLAIFFYGCNFDCLFCQNHSHKEIHVTPSKSWDELVSKTLRNDKISCWCFFGGSPEPQLPFSLEASKRALESIEKKRILRICFEWNGCGNKHLVRRAAELAFQTGGNIKFDLKCWDEELSYVLSGVSNRRAYENFEMIAREFHKERPVPPILTATTLLVPSYVDKNEVEKISKFIASLDPAIPYSLLVFHPDYEMSDLPITPRNQVESCYQAAKKYLRNVTVGNLHLLGFQLGGLKP